MDTLLPLLPPPNQRATLGGLRACGEERRAAYQAVQEKRRGVSRAIAVGLGAGVAPADIVRIATESYSPARSRPCSVHTRQSVYKVINAAEDIEGAHATAGRPGTDEALDALSLAVQAALPAVHEHELRRDVLARVMWKCIDAGLGRAEVAGACGFASAAAYRYLGLRERWNRVSSALDKCGLLHGDATSEDEFPPVLVRNLGTGIVLCNLAREPRVQQQLRECLAEVGERLGAGRYGDWVTVHPLENAT